MFRRSNAMDLRCESMETISVLRILLLEGDGGIGSMAAVLVVVWFDGRSGGKSADTNVTEDHERLRDHEPLTKGANWSTAAE
jgi:hypothetical protein